MKRQQGSHPTAQRSRLARSVLFVAALSLFVIASSPAQEQPAQIGYLYPAGGRQGTSFQVVVGGQFLRGPEKALFTGKGVRAEVVRHTGSFRFLMRQQQVLLLQKLWDLQEVQLKKTVRVNKEILAIRKEQRKRGPWKQLDADVDTEGYKLPDHPLLVDMEKRSFRELAHIQSQFFFPRNKLQDNRQISEHVLLNVTIAGNAEPGLRECRILAANGLTNPIRFQVGVVPEVSETEPNNSVADELARTDTAIRKYFPLTTHTPPVLINGQIMPGDIDRFQISAKKDQTLRIQASARDLIPFLADAVPGWFQAVISVYDSEGTELAFNDDDAFSPDPLLHFKVPADGLYEIAIRDAIYRGREDFVYRLSITDASSRTPPPETAPNPPPDLFAADTGSLQQPAEKEPNDTRTQASLIRLPHLVKGTIATPEDIDYFRFTGRAGDNVVAEVYARRIGSPLDSLLRLLDADGTTIAWNDDHVLKEKHLHIDHTGVTTHHADSALSATLPKTGTYFVQISDAQHHGGPDHHYKLRVSPPSPDYSLRVTPSGLAAPRGAVVPLTVYALRTDGFDAEIKVELKDAPPGTSLIGGTIPAGATHARMTLVAPKNVIDEPTPIRIEGFAKSNGQGIRRTAVPADNVMQAFLWRHLLPAQELSLMVTSRWTPLPPMNPVSTRPLTLAPGGRATVRLQCNRPFRRQEDDTVLLRLDQPPPGISIDQASTQAGPDIWLFDLVSDSSEMPADFHGNLIVEVLRESTQGKDRKKKSGKKSGKRVQRSIGYLPAIPIQTQP